MGHFGSIYCISHNFWILLDWAWSNWARPLLIGSLNIQDMISFMIPTESLNNQDMARILKQWRHDLSGKHLRDRYCMDIMWCLCGGQRSWFCKGSLRICYVSLFEWSLNGKNCYKLPCVEQKIAKIDWKGRVLLNCLHTFVFNFFCF